jgi:hypothetical protein
MIQGPVEGPRVKPGPKSAFCGRRWRLPALPSRPLPHNDARRGTSLAFSAADLGCYALRSALAGVRRGQRSERGESG